MDILLAHQAHVAVEVSVTVDLSFDGEQIADRTRLSGACLRGFGRSDQQLYPTFPMFSSSGFGQGFALRCSLSLQVDRVSNTSQQKDSTPQYFHFLVSPFTSHPASGIRSSCSRSPGPACLNTTPQASRSQFSQDSSLCSGSHLSKMRATSLCGL